jgi:DNA-binding NtrC family response regulator
MDDSIRIIVVDDEDSIRRRCVRLLSRQGYEVIGAADSQAALNLTRTKPFDLMLVDIRMPGLDGIELMSLVKADDPSVEAIVMTGYASVDTAVKAIKQGAYDYLAKPFDTDELLHIVGNLAEKIYSQREIRKLRSALEEKRSLPALVGDSPAMEGVKRFIQKVARVDCNILAYGESGTGKGLLAHLVHLHSDRADKPFMVADCAALAPSVFESELFGHVKGAFTGAHSDRAGYFESARGGTLFLDEIGELSLDSQARLLRAVQEQTITRVGDTRPIKVDVRLIAATNRDLAEMVEQGTFRQDLFFRLNVINCTMPPLREHPEDIPAMLDHFLGLYAARLNLPGIPDGARECLKTRLNHHWPGNVRELENAVQRCLILGVEEMALPEPGSGGPGDGAIVIKADPNSPLTYQALADHVVGEFSRQYLQHMLAEHKGNITRMAQAMGMRRTSLQRLIKRHGVDPEPFRR